MKKKIYTTPLPPVAMGPSHAREVLINFGVSLALVFATGLLGGYLLFIQMPEWP